MLSYLRRLALGDFADERGHVAGEGSRDKLAKGSLNLSVKGARHVKTIGVDRLDTHQAITDVMVPVFDVVGHGPDISQHTAAKEILQHVVEAAVKHDDVSCLGRVVVLKAAVMENCAVKAEGQLVDASRPPTEDDGIVIRQMVGVHEQLVDAKTSQVDLAQDRVS